MCKSTGAGQCRNGRLEVQDSREDQVTNGKGCHIGEGGEGVASVFILEPPGDNGIIQTVGYSCSKIRIDNREEIQDQVVT